MNAQMTGLAISLGAMQLARKIPMEDPEVLNYVRAGYVFTQLFSLALYFYVSMQIKKKNDLTVLKYVEPKSPMSTEQGGLITTTVKDYDLGETSKAMRSMYMGIAITGFMHLYMKFTQPVFIQSIMGLKSLYDAKVVAIHVLGKKPEGDLKRPFKAAGGLFGATADPATDAASIKEAEKIGAKKDE
ncbi:hypothetical protein BOTBODRAFT_31322 [Botryobasidium botryosum FD-172 SS1]|uniref:Inorganic phosphate transporter n=1 Tax=Botryobasidium botryosum (strain FD-172 SS1) TaxID=930990 RepID=A0A067MK15_BOTB1|nr:hypothetical protein BOTBODRAFT_31322 [Botryobasidium botryosum FD-172 SS1]